LSQINDAPQVFHAAADKRDVRPRSAMQPSPAELAALSASRPFHGVPADMLRAILANAVVRDVKPGERLIANGERHQWVYIVIRGELGVFADEGAKLALSKIGPGDCAGEQSVLDQGPAAALVVAIEPSRVAALGAEQAWEAMNRAPAIALNLLRVLAERIRQDNAPLRGGLDRQTMFEAATSTDSLTGLHNHRWMEDTFEREILRCERTGKPASLFMLDIDHFDEVNNTMGHRVGDSVLARLGELMRRALRPRDLCARFGGDKFCVLLPEVGARKALQAAERLRARVDAQPAQINRDVQIGYTVSIGVAEWQRGTSLEDLVKAADAAMLEAKNAGRNRVQLASAPAVRSAAAG